MPTVTQPSSRLITEGTFCGMKNEDQNPPTRHQQLGMKSTNHERTVTFFPLTAPHNYTTPSPIKDQEKAVETSQSAKSGYPLEKR